MFKKDNFTENSRDKSWTPSNNDLEAILDILANREGLSRDTIIKIVKKSIIESYCQGENSGAFLDFKFSDKLLINRVYKIVDNVSDHSKEIKKDSSLIKKGIVDGDNFFLPLDTKKFSFSLNKNISDKLNNYISRFRKDSKRKEDFKYFVVKLFASSKKIDKNKLYKGEIVNPRFIKRDDESNSIITYWKKEEWDYRKKQPFIGQKFYFVIENISSNESKEFITVTRQSDLFIKKILELQIPEISNSHVSIEHIIRVPKLINKVIVSSKVIGLDPIGACIGLDSERKRQITGLIFPERIDIIAKDNLSEKTRDSAENKRKKMFLDLLLPIRALSVIEDNDEITVFIPEEKISSISKDAEYNKRNTELLKKISDYIKKKIILKSADDLSKKASSLFLWNGNIKIDSLKSPKRKLW